MAARVLTAEVTTRHPRLSQPVSTGALQRRLNQSVSSEAHHQPRRPRSANSVAMEVVAADTAHLVHRRGAVRPAAMVVVTRMAEAATMAAAD